MHITIEDLFLILFVWIDDWYQDHYSSNHRVGRLAAMSDGEILTLMIAMDFMEFESECHYVAFLQAHYRGLFPHLLDHSHYNRRARDLGGSIEYLRQALGREIGVQARFIFYATHP